jgi:hypothetical protein
MMQPEISKQLKDRKVKTLEALTPDVIAAGNIGCMMQIGAGTGVPVVHTAELLDWATGGPPPVAAKVALVTLDNFIAATRLFALRVASAAGCLALPPSPQCCASCFCS